MPIFLWHTATELRWACYYKQDGKCFWCGCDCQEEFDRHNNKSATLEHLIPRSQGGRLSEENCRMACLQCNNTRGSQDAEEFRNSQVLKDIKDNVQQYYGEVA